MSSSQVQSLGELIPKDRVCELLGLCKSQVRGRKREGKPEPWRMVAANLWGEVGQRLGLEQRERPKSKIKFIKEVVSK